MFLQPGYSDVGPLSQFTMAFEGLHDHCFDSFTAPYSPSLPLSIGLFFFQHYKRSIHDSFEQHPNANYLVILEEDLDVSIDILSYFKQLLPVYEKDASVYCISAWNDQVWHPSCV